MKIGKYDYDRVTKAHPCPICGHDSWCAVARNREFILCARVGDGAVKTYSFGYLHAMDSDMMRTLVMPARHSVTPPSDVKKEYKSLSITAPQLTQLAERLCVKERALDDLGVRYRDFQHGPAWAFPMYSDPFNVIGIKYRNLNGEKWCAKGSKLGMYYPYHFTTNYQMPVCIAEGESDTAALLSAGFRAIGRACVNQFPQFLFDRCSRANCYIFADRDKDMIGLRESIKLRYLLGVQAQIVFNPKFKDVREWYKAGTLTEDSIIEHIYDEEGPS